MNDITLTSNRIIYNNAVWNVRTVQEAKRVILTEGGGLSPMQRWEIETPLLVEQILSLFPELSPSSWVLDYGVGVGRIAGPLIERTGCRVVGVDISPSMRALATNHVASERFVAVPPEMVPFMATRFDLALAVWSLQHAEDPAEAIALIRAMLYSPFLERDHAVRGKLFVLNDYERRVPTVKNTWDDDGLDIRALLQDGGFVELQRGEPSIGIADAPGWAFWGIYQ